MVDRINWLEVSGNDVRSASRDNGQFASLSVQFHLDGCGHDFQGIHTSDCHVGGGHCNLRFDQQGEKRIRR